LLDDDGSGDNPLLEVFSSSTFAAVATTMEADGGTRKEKAEDEDEDVLPARAARRRVLGATAIVDHHSRGYTELGFSLGETAWHSSALG